MKGFNKVHRLLAKHYLRSKLTANPRVTARLKTLDEALAHSFQARERFLQTSGWSLEQKIVIVTSLVDDRLCESFLTLTARLLEDCVHNPASFNGLFYFLVNRLFTGGAAIPGLDTNRFKVAELWPRYVMFMNAHFTGVSFSSERPQDPERARRIAIVTPQVKGIGHAPTDVLLEYTRCLVRAGKRKVLICDAELFPQELGPVIRRPFIADRPTPKGGAAVLRHEGVPFILWRTSHATFSRSKVLETVAMVTQYDPDLILSYGNFNMAADLLAQAFPVVQQPSTTEISLCLGHVFLHRDSGTGEAPFALAEGQIGQYRPYSFMPRNIKPGTPLSRQELDLPEEAFIFAIVGNRLNEELEPRFIGLVAELLRSASNAVLAVVSKEYNGCIEAGLAPELASRVRHVGYQDDLRGAYAAFDAVLNPIRAGGGGSLYLALLEGLPIVSLAQGDGETTLSRTLCVNDLQAYGEKALRLAQDPAFAAEERKRSKARAEETPLLSSSLSELEGLFRDAKEIFAGQPS